MFLAISFGVATGASLGLWLWRRTRSRFEAGIPVFRVSWPVWVLFLPLTILSAILFAFVLGLSEDWQNAVFWGEIMLIVVLVAMGMALRAVSVISIARYQSSKRTRLIAEYLGNSSLDVREVRILGEPRAS
ncbi:MAG TPA: hypothetical protein VEM95_05965 [Thermoplasmata archaeon]|nr:hypothetical protein [Thermoplasmata archaeon]